MESEHNGYMFLGHMLIETLTGQMPEKAVESLIRRLTCEWCALGWPIGEDGQHDMLGVVVPCEAVATVE